MHPRCIENVGRMTTPAERYAAAKLRGQHPVTTEFLLTFDFEFDPFQITACHAVEDGKGVLVAAPTGAGKTVVGEFAAFFALQAGKKCFLNMAISRASRLSRGIFKLKGVPGSSQDSTREPCEHE